MDEHLRKIQVTLPPFCVRDTMSELMRLGAILKGLAETLPLNTLYVEVPSAEISAFEAWLADASKGQGKVFNGVSANDEDA
jgi:hypothetical protein